MYDPSNPRIHVRAVRLLGWRAVAAIVAGITLLVAVAIFLALGFLLIVLPAMVLGTVVYFFLPKPLRRAAGDLNAGERAEKPTIIDATYRVTDDAAKGGRNGQE